MTTTADSFRQAETYLDEGAPRAALELLDRDGHDGSAALLLRARAYYHSAQFGRAEATLRELLETDPVDDYARFLLGRTLERASRPDEALTCYRLATAMAPVPAYAEHRDRLATGSRAAR